MAAIDLSTLDREELQSFFNSFDNVLCDCDGVILHLGKLIPGADETLSKLTSSGKNVRFVTNNSYLGLDKFCEHLKRLNINAKPCDVANPCLAIITYLRQIKFDSEVCILGSSHFKEEVRSAGFKVVDLEMPNSISDNIGNTLESLKLLIKKNSGIGAIVFDIDLSLSYVKLSTVLGCLQNPNVLFLTACADKALPMAPNVFGIGPQYFIKPVEDLTGRKPLAFGKPDQRFHEFLVEKFGIDNPPKTLFIGDSLENDIAFANRNGFQTLLVLTGTTQHEDMTNYKNKEQIPKYYLSSLGKLHELLSEKLVF